MDDRTQEFTPQKKKEPFQLDLHFDDDEDIFSQALASLDDAPPPKGEVYFSNPPKPEPAAATPTGKRNSRKKNRQGFPTVAVLVAVSLLVAVFLSYVGITALQDIFAIGRNPLDTREYIVNIPESGMTTDEIIGILADEGLIRQRTISRIYARFTHWLANRDNPDRQPEYLAADHIVLASWGLEEMLDSFRTQRRRGETVVISFPEHFTVQQVFNRLAQNRVASVESLHRVMATGEFDFDFIRAFEDIDDADLAARFFLFEGYLFPDTYEFYVNENPHSVINRFLTNFNNRWVSEYDARARELGMTIDEVIILASIIQMEAANAEQMPYVSSVLHNRMNNTAVFPRLQCDATRDYVMANIAPEVEPGTVAFYNNMFNTYVRDGLPAGPINNPGLDAIEAALYPHSTDYYFFQHDRNREIYLSRTVQEHNRITADLVIQGLNQP